MARIWSRSSITTLLLCLNPNLKTPEADWEEEQHLRRRVGALDSNTSLCPSLHQVAKVVDALNQALTNLTV